MNLKSSASSEWVFTPDIFRNLITDASSLLSSSTKLFKLIVDIIQYGIIAAVSVCLLCEN